MNVPAQWYEAIAYVLMGEMAYAYARYLVGTARDRRAFFDAVVDYAVTAAVVVVMASVVNALPSIAQGIAGAIGLSASPTLGSNFSAWPGVVMGWFREAWFNYASWTFFIAILKGLGGISVAGFRLGFLSALADFLNDVFTGPFTEAMMVLMGDLAFTYALAWVVVVMNNYGLIGIAQVLLIPRSTRFIGATLLAIYMTSVVALVIYSIIIPHYVLPLTAWYAQFVPPCAWHMNIGNLTAIINDAACIGELIALYYTVGPTGVFLMQEPTAIFRLMAWSILLAIGYALTEGITYGLAGLIDEGVVRVRLRR